MGVSELHVPNGVIRWSGNDNGIDRHVVARRRRAGDLVDVFPGVSVEPHLAASYEHRAIAASWSCDGFISHATAARLHGLRSWQAVRELHVSTLRDRVLQRDGVTVHRRLGLADVDIVGYAEGARIASVALTLLDVAFTARPIELRSAYHDAWHRELVTPAQVIETLARLGRSGRPGGPKLRAMIERYPITGNPARSLNEIRVYDAVFDDPSLPNPLLNHRVVRSSGVPAFIDLAWPQYMFGLEVDHTETHAETWAADVTRMEELNDLGWTIDRVMEDRMHQLPALVARLGRRLRQHGWQP